MPSNSPLKTACFILTAGSIIAHDTEILHGVEQNIKTMQLLFLKLFCNMQKNNMPALWNVHSTFNLSYKSPEFGMWEFVVW